MIPVSEPVLGGREAEYVAECLDTGWISSAAASSRRSKKRGRPTAADGTASPSATARSPCSWPSPPWASARATRSSCRRSRSSRARWRSSTRGRRRCSSTPIPRRGAWMSTRSRRRSPRGRGRSCRSTSTAIRWTWTRSSTWRERHGLAIIEDAAEAHGAEYLSRPRTPSPPGAAAAASATLSCFSFYANKLVTTGEGGMVLTDDERARPAPPLPPQPRFRARAALPPPGARLQLPPDERPGGHRARPGGADRRDRGPQARDRPRGTQPRLAGVGGIRLQPERDWARSVYWMYGLVLDRATGLDARGLADATAGLAAWRRGRSSSACTPAGPPRARAVRRRERIRSPTRSPSRVSTSRPASASPTTRWTQSPAATEEALA